MDQEEKSDKIHLPGMLDHLVAGGLPDGIACGENIMKECEEGAGIPRSISNGEAESFKLIPVAHVANVIRRTYLFKPNCCLVIMDFLFRHGYIHPKSFGFLDLLRSQEWGLLLVLVNFLSTSFFFLFFLTTIS